MNKVVIRILWPQLERHVADWQCEYSELPSSHIGQVAERMSLMVAFQQAAAVQLAHGTGVSILLPAELATLDCVQLPALNQRQALQALPFVVEERLADDIERVHMAIGKRRQDGNWPVLVVELAIMAALLDCSEQTGLLLTEILVDAQMLQADVGQLSIVLHEGRALFHSSKVVSAFDLDSASSMIHLLVGEDVISHVRIIYQDSDEQQRLLAQQLSAEYSALGDTQVVMDTMTDTLPVILFQQASLKSINLLQGRFTVKRATGLLPWWQIAAAVLLFAWMGQLGLQVSSGWYFNRTAGILERLAEDQYRKIFPEAKQVSNPRKRLEARLADASNGGGDFSFAWIFGVSMQTLQSLPDHDGLSVEQLRYEGKRGQLELELKAKTIDQLDHYKQALAKVGLSGKISSASDSNGSISGRMQITKGI
ncbi:MAG TPA: type II secretion system protein GspL [Pseudomonadales bacterium]|nr:type II secretion system protein GspL [Pseudomonadales bacterium]